MARQEITNGDTGLQVRTDLNDNFTELYNQDGTLSSLTTTVKTDLVSAINEVDANTDTNTTNIGTLGSLTTTEKSTLVGAINEVDSNTDTNTTNITSNTNKIDNSFYADLHAYYGNTKLLDDFQDGTPWTVSNGVESDDTTNVKIGSQSIRATAAGATSLITNQNNASFDFSILNNGETSTDSDYIYFVIYIEDVAQVTQSSSFIAFSQDASYAGANFKAYTFSTELATGWNYLKLLKSDFSTSGTGAWSGIQSIRIAIQTTGAIYYSTQLIQLVKKDPSSTVPNPFQRNGVADFTINSGEWFIGKEYGEILIKELSLTASVSIPLQSIITYTDCIMYAKMRSEANFINRYLTFYIDGNNHFYVWSNDTQLRLTTVIAGATTTYDTTFVSAADDIVEFKVVKESTKLKVTAYVNGDYNTPYYNEADFSPTSAGTLGLGRTTASQYYYGASISDMRHAHHSDIAEVAKTVPIKTNAGVFVSDELKYGEFGLDTSNNRLYMKYSATQVIYFGGTVV